MVLSSEFQSQLQNLLDAARNANHRRLLVLNGSADWARAQAFQIIKWLIHEPYRDFDIQPVIAKEPRAGSSYSTSEFKTVWVGEPAPELMPLEGVSFVPSKHFVRCLGTECQCLIYDAYDGFNPDAVAAVSGTVMGGGLFILITPSLSQWQSYADPDYQRMLVFPQTIDSVPGHFLKLMAESLVADKSVMLASENGTIRSDVHFQGSVTKTFSSSASNFAVPSPCPFTNPSPHDQAEDKVIDNPQANTELTVSDYCRTPDQGYAVEAVIKVVNGHRRRPLVLTADRGRGKSATLGIAAAQLMKQQSRHIIVTAPRAEAITTLFFHARQLLEAEACGDTTNQGVLSSSAGEICYCVENIESRLCFLPPDLLLREKPKADLILVDEAAAIPAPMLEALTGHYARIAFATTVHGYEGSGRGFEIRFSKVLDRLTPGWRGLRMLPPIRWSDGDPLEAWIFNSMLLNADVVPDSSLDDIDLEQLHLEPLGAQQLLDDHSLLIQVFALLVQAHYRTTPGDLRDLLDGSNLDLHVLKLKGAVVGALLLAREGEFDDELAQGIWAGKRRPRGHQLPQILCGQAGWLESARLSYLRVVRIAVHPKFQNQGLGSLMLKQLSQIATLQQADFVGATFAATPELTRFWLAADYSCVRMGLSRDASSGCHSALVIKPLSDLGKQQYYLIYDRYQSQFFDALKHGLSGLEPEMVQLLASEMKESSMAIERQDQLDLVAYIYANRGFEQVRTALSRFAQGIIKHPDLSSELSAQQLGILITRVLQGRSWSDVAALYGLSGKKQTELQLRTLLKRPFEQCELNEQVAKLSDDIG